MMCGIAGIIGCADLGRIQRMTSILAHRGPDGTGVEVLAAEGVALGHRRLSILDLSERGRQPMSDPAGLFWITFNGEIYNFLEVRRQLEAKGRVFRSNTDTEVVLYAYAQWGADCLARLNGMFAFAIWDRRDRTLFAARDRLGVKPFYYCHVNHAFLFASEVKAILESGLAPREIDYQSLHTPALYQTAPFTGFKHILKLPPGHFLRLRDEQLTFTRYWTLEPRESRIPFKAAVEQLDELISSAVRLQMISDVPVGAFLSGGLDSSLIVALMRNVSADALNTFTIRYSEDDQKFEKMPDDSRYARIVADLFDCQHHEFTIESGATELLQKMVWHLDEPLSDPATINTYLISKAAREKGIVVLLNGMGGDEVFGGYRSQLACLWANYYQAYVPEVVHSMTTRVVERLPLATNRRGIRFTRWAKRFLALASERGDQRYVTAGMMSGETYRSLFAWDRVAPASLFDHEHSRARCQRLQRRGLSYVTRMCLADTEIYLPDHNLNYSDKCTMAAGVEGRPPFTDHRIVECMFSLHPSFRIRRATQKYLLKKVAEKYLPNKIIYRPKAPFGAPLRAWIRGDLAEMVRDYLSVESLKRRGIYNPQFVWQAIERDRTGQEDNAHLIWRLLCNEMWFRTWFN